MILAHVYPRRLAASNTLLTDRIHYLVNNPCVALTVVRPDDSFLDKASLKVELEVADYCYLK
jgi:hypothetical protein